MECKKCGVDLSDKEYRNVAQWYFCLECFQALMDRAEEKKEIAETPAREPARTPQRCLVCEKEIEQGTGHEMLGLMFCLQCYESLVKKPDIPPRTENEQKEAGMARVEKPAVAQIRVDFHSPVKCHGCKRQIPAIGSKQFDGNSYCPDCYHALPEIKAQETRPFPAPVSGQTVAEKEHALSEKPEAGLRCQACQRQVLPMNLKTVEGFEICQACMTTDPDTALEIARTRHRRSLEKLKKEL